MRFLWVFSLADRNGYLYCYSSSSFLVQKKIPELMRGLGSGIREFKKASNGEDLKDSTSEKKDTE